MGIEIERYSDEWGPEKILHVHDPKTQMRGVLIIDNTTLGPGKGGIRMLPTITTEEIFRLARTMTWKCAIAELRFGGAKSGIVANPKSISKEEKKRIVQSFSRALKPVCPKQYIAAPDLNTGEEEMAVFVRENGSMKAATGKPAHLCVKPGEKCGIPHEYGSTGLGVVQATITAANFTGIDIENVVVAIDGFGNVGSYVAEYLTQIDVKVVAVSDSKGGIYDKEGLDFEKLSEVKRKTHSVVNYKKGKVLGNKEIFKLPVDILIPAALSDVITMDNVDHVKAKMVVEAANIPMKPEIEEILRKRGILVVPDIVANAGGVISSYAEYRGYNPKKMLKLVQRRISRNTQMILEYADKEDVGPRDSALIIARERIRRGREN